MPKRDQAMTTADFRKALKALGMTPYRAARHLGVSIRQSHRYASGETAVPTPVAMVLRELLQHRFHDRLNAIKPPE